MLQSPGFLSRGLIAISAGLVAWSCRRPLITLLLALVLTAASLGGAYKHLRLDTSTEDMLSPELPFRQALIQLRSAFPNLGQTLVVVVKGPGAALADRAAEQLSSWMSARPDLYADVFYPEGDPFLREHGLLYLSPDALAGQIDRLAAAQGLLATLAEEPSLVGLSSVLLLALNSGEAEQLEDLEPVLEQMARTGEALAAGKPALLSWQQVIEGESDSDSLRIILALPALDYASLAPAKAAMEGVQKTARALNLEAQGIEVLLTGKPALRADELRSIRTNIAGIGLLSFALVALILWRGLGSIRAAVSVGLLLVVGLALTAGFATLAVGRLNLLSVAFAVLFIGLSVDYAIHSLLRSSEFRLAGLPQAEAAVAGARVQAPALWLCAISSIVAFLAFLPTDYLGLAELGLISAGGIAIALFLCFTLLPATLLLLRTPPLNFAAGALAARLESSLADRRRAVLVLAALLALAAGVAITNLRFDNDPLSLRDPDSPSVQALVEVMSDPRAVPYRAEVLLPDLAQAEAVAEALRALPEVDSAVTLQSFVPKDQDEKLAQLGDASFLLAPLLFTGPAASEPTAEERQAAVAALIAGLRTAPEQLVGPASGLAAALAIFLQSPDQLPALETALIGDLPSALDTLRAALNAGPFGLQDLPQNLASRYIAADGQALVEIRPLEDLRDPALREDFVEAVLAVAPTAGGDAVTLVAAGQTVIEAFATASLLAFGLVALLVFLVLRRLDDSFAALLPLVLAALYCGGLAVAFGVELNFANVIVLPLLFGLGIDSGLHLVARRREAPDKPLMENATPRAVLVSALTTLASFGALSLSNHPGTASMGQLLLLALACVLAAVFLVLPALIGRPSSSLAARGPES
ncbi:MAG: MMPL family transporter [Pseudomonadota bacterium]